MYLYLFAKLNFAILRRLHVRLITAKWVRLATGIWKCITLDYLKALYESMLKGMTAVIDAQCQNTKV